MNSEPFAPTLAGFFGRPARSANMISPSANFDDRPYTNLSVPGRSRLKFEHATSTVLTSSRAAGSTTTGITENIFAGRVRMRSRVILDENSAFAAVPGRRDSDMGKPIPAMPFPPDQVAAKLEADGFQVAHRAVRSTWVQQLVPTWTRRPRASPMGDVRVRKAALRRAIGLSVERDVRQGSGSDDVLGKPSAVCIGAVRRAWAITGGRQGLLRELVRPGRGAPSCWTRQGYGDGVDRHR